MRRLTGALVVAAMAAALLGAPVASAALTDDVAAVGSDVGAVTEAATKGLPDLPVPIETPGVPKAPAPVPSPASKPSPSVSTPSAPAATETPEAVVHGFDGGAGEAVTGSPPEAAGPGASTGPSSEPGGRGPDRHSIDPAETAPTPRWRTYVWPAIALRVEAALRPLLARLDGFVEIRLPDVFGLLSPPAAPAIAGIDRPSERPEPPGQDLQSPAEVTLPEEGMGLLATLLIGLLTAVGLVALARLAVGEDLFETRYWRGHRG